MNASDHLDAIELLKIRLEIMAMRWEELSQGRPPAQGTEAELYARWCHEGVTALW